MQEGVPEYEFLFRLHVAEMVSVYEAASQMVVATASRHAAKIIVRFMVVVPDIIGVHDGNGLGHQSIVIQTVVPVEFLQYRAA